MSQPSFSRAPGSQFQPTPPRTPSLALNSPTLAYSHPNLNPHDPFSSAPFATDLTSSSPQDFRTTFSGGARSPALVPGSGGGALSSAGGPSNPATSGVLDSARPYPLVERRSFRDVSSQGDVVVSREQMLSNGSALGSAGAGAIGERRKSNMAGAIGEARRNTTPSPSIERGQEEFALGLPQGTLDALAVPADEARSETKSRPSSFILDVLPQARERNGSATPSLSLDSISQPPSTSSTSDAAFAYSPNSLAPAAQPSPFFQNTNLASSTTSLGAYSTNGGSLAAGGNALSSSRTSSPGPLDLTGYTNMSNGSSTNGSLASKVNTLETTVADLSALIATEFRSLRDEVSLLRSLVYQGQGGLPSGLAQRPALEHRYSSQPSVASHDRGDTESPLLTLRSPSPHHASAFPAPIPLSRGTSFHGSNHSNSTLLGASHGAPPPLSPHSAPGSFFPPVQQATSQSPVDRLRQNEDDSSVKDEQIKLLTQQVNSLSTTVSNLLSSAASNAGPNPMSVAMSTRQMSLPVPNKPAVGLASPSLDHAGPSWASKREGTSGLGVGTGPGQNGLGYLNGKGPGPIGVGMGMRSLSQGGVGGGGGLGRSASLRSASASHGQGPQVGPGGPRMDQGNFDTIGGAPAWDNGVASPMLGGGPSNGLNSPMLGSSAGPSSASGGGPGTTSNPPGSLGSKWEVLGIGNELFRAIAKYGLGPPTKIQSKSIPCVVRGQDVVAQAPAIQERIQSYVIPALQVIFAHASTVSQQYSFDAQSRGIQAIVITATVDQAAQAQRLAVGLGSSLGIRTSLCVGSTSTSEIQNELSTLLKAPPHILVGTPQKLLDLFMTRALPTNDVRLLIIDECDQLIARNLSDFVLQLAKLLPPVSTSSAAQPNGSPTLSRSPLPGAFDSGAFSSPMARFGSNASLANGGGESAGVERQMAIFSCTVPQDVLNFAANLQLREPVRVLVRRENGGDGSSPSMRSLKQYYLYLAVGAAAHKNKGLGAGRRDAGNAREWKLEALADLCEDHPFDHAVVFASSLETVDAIQYKLGSRAIEAHALHQDLSTSARQQTISKFRSTAPNRPGLSSKRVLIVYDALSRNLADVQQVGLVINFDLPRAVEDYIHRISCAATSSFNSKAPSMILNIVTPSDIEMLRGIESFYRCKIQELPPNFATSSTASSQ
ncbi:hypothetical protein JCM10212_005926 [Sporobolomyces blumeae]